MTPTLNFRWLETEARMDGPPVAMTPFYAENGPIHYKLQQYWDSPYVEDEGEWRDIEI